MYIIGYINKKQKMKITIMKKQVMKLYAAVSKDFGAQFAFHALDNEDAIGKMAALDRYHSFTGSDKRTIKEITETDLPSLQIGIHDEYMD